MLKHFLITGFRIFRRNRAATLLNVAGLSIGLTTVILIMEYVFDEISYDRFHANQKHIYRVIIKEEKEAEISPTPIITAAIGPSMAEEFREVDKFVRFANPSGCFLATDERNFPLAKLSYADSSLFEVFSFSLLRGDPKKALAEPFQVVLTESAARRIFGDSDPLRQVVRLNNKENLMVSGVMKDFPSTSHLDFDALISFSTLYQDKSLYLDWDGGWNYSTYVLLYPGSELSSLKEKFPDFMEKNINYKYRSFGFILHLDLQPLKRIHLFSGKDLGLEGEGDLQALYIFSSIALFILIIACVHFMNLTTARSFMRSREIGMRKVSGASRMTIIFQFLFETMMISGAAFIIALILADFLQPEFNSLTGKDLSLTGSPGLKMAGGIILLLIVTSLLAGSYPAWFISRFPALMSIKGTMISGKGKSSLRNILVVFQYLVSLILLIMTLAVFTQMRFMNSLPLGFDKEDVMVIPLVSEEAKLGSRALINAFNSLPPVRAAGASSEVPGEGFTMNGYFPEGFKEPVMINVLDIDADYLGVMNIPLIQGRGFDKASGSDSASYIINETLAKKLGWGDPVGKTIYRDGPHKVIGVVGDFHFASLHQPLQPLILTKQPWIGYNFISVRIDPGNREEAIRRVESAWNSELTGEPFDYFFQSDFIRNSYNGVRHATTAILWFSFLSIIIAGLGLMGLANFTFSLRRKEIGIRKVLGAETPVIARRVTFEFLRLVIIAGVIALPLAWLLMDKWLGNFAYRTMINPMIFILPVIFVLILAWITIYFQVKKLANTNPVNVLKFE
ncbi:MAG TPA: ABC transporter permease [Bacteroidales bacterium]|nr:ABC transporter permease [Bacteroidales bacterium]